MWFHQCDLLYSEPTFVKCKHFMYIIIILLFEKYLAKSFKSKQPSLFLSKIFICKKRGCTEEDKKKFSNCKSVSSYFFTQPVTLDSTYHSICIFDFNKCTVRNWNCKISLLNTSRQQSLLPYLRPCRVTNFSKCMLSTGRKRFSIIISVNCDRLQVRSPSHPSRKNLFNCLNARQHREKLAGEGCMVTIASVYSSSLSDDTSLRCFWNRSFRKA